MHKQEHSPVNAVGLLHEETDKSSRSPAIEWINAGFSYLIRETIGDKAELATKL
jgi:hypothetical protein